VCIIGSTKFRKEIKDYAWKLTKKKILVLFSPFAKEIKELEKYREELELQHFQKIELSDCVIVFNKNNYIGESTKRELHYAISIDKLIYSYKEFEFLDFLFKKSYHFYPLINLR